MAHKIPTIDIKKYGGKEVAILNGKIIASGKSLSIVIKQLKQKRPTQPIREILFLNVPKSLTVIYYA